MHTSRSHSRRVALVCVFLVALFAGGAAAELVTRNYTAYKNRENVINFKTILPKDITFGMVVSILKPYPTKGSLQGLRANGNKTDITQLGDPPSVSTHTFFYKPQPQDKYPSTDALRYSVAGGNPEASTEEQGVLNIVIINQPPRATPLTYRTVGTQPRTVTLRFRDFDEPIYRSQLQYVNGESTEVKLVEVVKILTGNCTLTQNTTSGLVSITGEHVKLTPPYQLIYTPSSNFTTVGASCQFSYRVQDVEGAWSNEAIVTLQSKVADKPRAYGSTQVARIGVDGYVLLTLQSSSGNGRAGRAFWIRSIPSAGAVFLQEEEGRVNSSRPLKVLPGQPLQLPKNKKRDTRLVLAYQPPAPTDARGGWNGSEYVMLTWYVTDAGGQSDDAFVTIHLLGKDKQRGPLCGVTVLDPVFVNKPYRRITLNYTIPEGNRIQRVTFVTVPASPLGDFYVADSRDNDANAKKLGVGNMFNDARQHLFFQVRKPAPSFPDRFVQNYTFRVKNYNRQSCLGVVEVHFRTHDAPVATGPAGQLVVGDSATRTESCKLQHLTLLSLRGMANQTIEGGPANVAAVRIVELPTYGQLYSVANTLPFKRGKYAVFCDETNCTQYINETLGPDSIVPIRIYDPEQGLDSGNRIYVLYRSPNVMPSGERDAFSYKFISKTGSESTATQRVNMRLRDASADTLTFFYDKQSENRILIQLSNKTTSQERVEVLSKKHGHGHSRRIKLFQLKDVDGNRSVLGDEIADKPGTEGDMSNGMFVVDEQNRIVIVPEVATHRRIFTMHVKRYPVNPDGSLDFESALTYRVRVKRRNHAPHWEAADCKYRVNCADSAENTMNASDATMQFIFAVNDEDNDSITFVLKTPPKFGTITYERMGLSGNTLRTASKGTRIQMKKATNGLRDLVILYYNHKAPAVLSRGMKYPVVDEFEIFGDDGLDRTSVKKVKIVVTAKADLKNTVEYIDNFKANSRAWLSSSLAVAIAVGVSIMMVVIMVTIVVRRKETRRRYMQLPVVVNQAQAGSGSAAEMAPRKSNPELISLARGSNGD